MGPTRLLSDEGWNQLQDVAERFEKDCADAFPRRVADYLPSPGEPYRDDILDELLRIDLELHWRRGKGNFIEQYLEEFPELTRDRDRFLRLIEDEYRVRGAFGDCPAPEVYVERFPELRAEIERKLKPRGSDEFKTMESAVEIPFAAAGNLSKVRRIGEGAFGEVWECRAPGGVPVAVKRIFATVSPKLIEREKQSLDLICSGKFRHPFLLQVFGWWVQSDRVHIVMELADESLDDRLKQAKSNNQLGLPLDDDLAHVLRDAGDALDFLNHKCRILHRDVKPANMLLMGGRLKLCDFGLSRMTQNLGVNIGKTMGAGTPVFIAPEIVQGYQSMQSDQYSLAVSYCMLRTGRPLFRGTVKEIRDQHVHAAPALRHEYFTPAEEKVLMKALAKEPTERFKNSSEFVNELLAASKIGRHKVLPQPVPSPSLPDPVRPSEAKKEDELTTRFVPVKKARGAAKIGVGLASVHPEEAPGSPAGTPRWIWIVLIALIFVIGFFLGGLILPNQ